MGPGPGSNKKGQLWEGRVKGEAHVRTLSSASQACSYRVAQESLAGISNCSQGIIHISLARQAANTAVQCLGHSFRHLE